MLRLLFFFLVFIACVVPATEVTTLIAGGASFPSLLYRSLNFAFSSKYPQLSLNYYSLGSSRGKCLVVGNCASYSDGLYQVDFGASDSIHKPIDYVLAPDLNMYPAVAGAVVPIFNLKGVSKLVLLPHVVADIFRACLPDRECAPGFIQYWNDSRILDSNPSIDPEVLTRAGRIQVVVRAEGSGTTEIWKQSLAVFSVEFKNQFKGYLDDSIVWPNVSVIYSVDNRGVSSTVLNTHASIGYVSLDEAMTSGNTYAGMGTSILNEDGILRATSRSVQYALLERGFNFGNNNDSKEHLTASVMGARGSEAWPAVGLTYFTTRSNLTGAADCSRRVALLRWFDWFYHDPVVDIVSETQGFVSLPSEGKRYVFDKLQARLRCNGVRAVDLLVNANLSSQTLSRVIQVPVNVPLELTPTLLLYMQSYSTGPNGMASLIPVHTEKDDAFFSIADSQFEHKQGKEIVPFTAIPFGVTYNFCFNNFVSCSTLDHLVLDLSVLHRMLTGQITFWNDTAIKQLQSTEHDQWLLPNRSISVVLVNNRNLHTFLRLMDARGFPLPSNGLQSTLIVNSSEQANRFVNANPFSFTIGPVNMNDKQIMYARMRTSNGSIVLPTPESMRACIFPREDNISLQFSLVQHGSAPPDLCWPLANAYFLYLPSQFTDAQCATRLPQESTLFAASLLKASVSTLEQIMGFAGLVLSLERNFTLALDGLTCEGRSIANPVVDWNLLPLGLTVTAQVFAVLVILFVLCMAVWVRFHVRHPVINKSSPVFLYQMCFGLALEVSSIFPLSVQDGSGESQQMLDSACQAVPWLYAMGLSLVYTGLLVKTWRIYRIFHNPQMRTRMISNQQLFKLEFAIFVPIILILFLWQMMDPMTWRRTVFKTDSITGMVVATTGVCASNNNLLFLGPLIGFVSFLFIAGLYLAWKNRIAPTDFSEGRYVSAAIFTDVELLVLGIPLLVISGSNVLASYLVKVLLILISVLSTIGIFFYPKFAIIHDFWDTDSSSNLGGNKNLHNRQVQQRQAPHSRSASLTFAKNKVLSGGASASPSPSNSRKNSQDNTNNNNSSLVMGGSFYMSAKPLEAIPDNSKSSIKTSGSLGQ